jgi:hypothetical protein
VLPYIPSIINEDLQGMFARICVLDDNIHHIHVLDHEAQWSVRAFHCCILPECELGEDGWYQGGIISDLVEHGVVSAVIHGIEHELEFDRLRHTRLGDLDHWHKASIIHVVVFVNKSEVG